MKLLVVVLRAVLVIVGSTLALAGDYELIVKKATEMHRAEAEFQALSSLKLHWLFEYQPQESLTLRLKAMGRKQRDRAHKYRIVAALNNRVKEVTAAIWLPSPESQPAAFPTSFVANVHPFVEAHFRTDPECPSDVHCASPSDVHCASPNDAHCASPSETKGKCSYDRQCEGNPNEVEGKSSDEVDGKESNEEQKSGSDIEESDLSKKSSVLSTVLMDLMDMAKQTMPGMFRHYDCIFHGGLMAHNFVMSAASPTEGMSLAMQNLRTTICEGINPEGSPNNYDSTYSELDKAFVLSVFEAAFRAFGPSLLPSSTFPSVEFLKKLSGECTVEGVVEHLATVPDGPRFAHTFPLAYVLLHFQQHKGTGARKRLAAQETGGMLLIRFLSLSDPGAQGLIAELASCLRFYRHIEI